MASYTIVGKKLDSVEISIIAIQDTDGNVKNIKYSSAVKLAQTNELENGHAILDISTGDYILGVDGGINNIPDIEPVHVRLAGRIMEEGKCIGYKVVDNTGKKFRLSSQKVWDLAEQGAVVGVTAKLNGENKVLIDSDICSFRELPELN